MGSTRVKKLGGASFCWQKFKITLRVIKNLKNHYYFSKRIMCYWEYVLFEYNKNNFIKYLMLNVTREELEIRLLL